MGVQVYCLIGVHGCRVYGVFGISDLSGGQRVCSDVSFSLIVDYEPVFDYTQDMWFL
jgi:hypothetical protein